MSESSQVEARLASLQAWVIGGLCFLLTFAGSFTAWGAYQGAKISDNRNQTAIIAAETHAALCTLKMDIERRLADSKRFLKEHPDGIPGISADVIRNSITNEQQTVDALATLNC